MNIAFFLLPKQDVVCLNVRSTMRQALEKMEYHRYTAVPIIDDDGKYVGTLTEGDLLRKLKDTPGLDFSGMHTISVEDIPRRVKNKPVSVNAQMESLISLAVDQNFVPVVDDQGVFIGIIRRKEIIEYCYEKLFKRKRD